MTLAFFPHPFWAISGRPDLNCDITAKTAPDASKEMAASEQSLIVSYKVNKRLFAAGRALSAKSLSHRLDSL